MDVHPNYRRFALGAVGLSYFALCAGTFVFLRPVPGMCVLGMEDGRFLRWWAFFTCFRQYWWLIGFVMTVLAATSMRSRNRDVQTAIGVVAFILLTVTIIGAVELYPTAAWLRRELCLAY